MFRRFLRHKVNRDKGLLLIFPKHPLFPRLLRGTFVGNVNPGRQWRVASEDRVASESGERGEPTQQECPAPQNVQDEANPESTQGSLPLEVESSVPEPPGRKQSQSAQAVASGERRVDTGQWPVNGKRGRPR